jgi:hypothetical protein
MLKKLMLLCLLLPMPAFAVGLVVGKKINYVDDHAKVNYTGQGSVVVITFDERPYVLAGDKKPDFVGVMRGGYGIPFDVRNETGHPVADDISTSLAISLKAAGFNASVEIPKTGETAEQAIARLAATSPGHILVVRLRNLRTDGYASLIWYEEATMSVYDASGTLRHSMDTNLRKELGSLMHKWRTITDQIMVEFNQSLETLLNDAKMQGELAPGSAIATAPPAAPTTAPAADAPAPAVDVAPEAAATAPATDAPAAATSGAN